MLHWLFHEVMVILWWGMNLEILQFHKELKFYGYDDDMVNMNYCIWVSSSMDIEVKCKVCNLLGYDQAYIKIHYTIIINSLNELHLAVGCLK